MQACATIKSARASQVTRTGPQMRMKRFAAELATNARANLALVVVVGDHARQAHADQSAIPQPATYDSAAAFLPVGGDGAVERW